MTQPPDDRWPSPSDPESSSDPESPADGDQPAAFPPDEAATPGDPTASENAPTVAWTPPDTGETPLEPTAPPETVPPPVPDEQPASASSPIISADAVTPSASGWEVPASPTPFVPAVSGGGWETPTGAGPVLLRPGYVAGSIGGRFVAWLIDGLLSSLIPGALFLFVFDWAGFFRNVLDRIQVDASGRVIPTAGYAYTIPITLDVILLYLILVAVQFLYFVGFWTSRWQATPGMIGLKMRVVDANTGAGLTILQATKRWIAMGWWLGLLALVPALQSAGSLAQFAVNLFLFFSIVTNDRKQGLHDKFAGSQVIRSSTSGDGATLLGCLVYVVMVIAITIVAGVALFAIAGPTFIDFAREMPRYQP